MKRKKSPDGFETMQSIGSKGEMSLNIMVKSSTERMALFSLFSFLDDQPLPLTLMCYCLIFW